MPIQVVDSNILGNPTLCQYLSASTGNRIAIPYEVMLEQHKTAPIFNITKSLEHARRFPKQVYILRCDHAIYELAISSAVAAKKLIDWGASEQFPQWYDKIARLHSRGESSAEMERREHEAQRRIALIKSASLHLEAAFRKEITKLSKCEKKEIRSRRITNPETYRKLKVISYEMAAFFFRDQRVGHILPKIKPKNELNNLLFRMALCNMLYFARWVNTGNLSLNPERLVNDVLDLRIAAIGTMFKGVLGNDGVMRSIHRDARYILRLERAAYLG